RLNANVRKLPPATTQWTVSLSPSGGIAPLKQLDSSALEARLLSSTVNLTGGTFVSIFASLPSAPPNSELRTRDEIVAKDETRMNIHCWVNEFHAVIILGELDSVFRSLDHFMDH
ncbi:hypothetical protein K0M31_007833, partial [Melipona bicolor]